MESTSAPVEDPVTTDVRRIPGFVEASLVASVHRRAAEAALLRDRRLQLEIGRSGELRMRMIQHHARIA